MKFKTIAFLSFFLILPIGAYRTSFLSVLDQTTPQQSKLTIMLSPLGDSKNPGREVPDGTERGINRQLCEHIKQQLEQLNSSIRVVLSHNSGEVITQDDKANFANRLQVKLYISISLFPDDNLNCSLYWYGKPGDTTRYQPKKLSLCKKSDAHIFSQSISEKICQQLHSDLTESPASNNIVIFEPQQLPIKSLMGIKAPACAFEASVKQTGDWQYYIDLFAQAINQLLSSQANL